MILFPLSTGQITSDFFIIGNPYGVLKGPPVIGKAVRTKTKSAKYFM
jgi:hypothetical protein